MARVVEDSSLLYDSLLWIEKYFNFLEYHDDFENGRQEFPDEFKKIEVKDLSFTYPFSDDEVLHNVSYSVDGFASIDDSKTDILNENGTLSARVDSGIDIYLFCYNKDFELCLKDYFLLTGSPTLIPRYALGNWWSRNIMYNDDNLKDFNIFDLHKNLSATFQDFSRFKLTLKENVITGYSFNKERVNNVLKAAGLENLLANDHLQLGTILAKDFENGTDLSGGQWQKIALARDLYANGKIEFLDEPTAALDAKSEAEIYERFLRENSQKTIFFVTHRLSAVKFADKVLFLDSGKVSGFDTHANLLNKNAKYQEMYNLQKNAYI